jgi:glyoxylase-like metal-dependent hydrolase (beta-lactamase superfamily II)
VKPILFIRSSSLGLNPTIRDAGRFGSGTIAPVEVTQVEAGLWRWTAFHEEWKQVVGCVYLESGGDVVLIDPLVPADEADRFWAALDRDVERAGGTVHVLVTVFWHTRSAAAIVERYGARVWAPTRGKGAIERRVGTVTDTFRPASAQARNARARTPGARMPGDALPGGVVPLPTARAAEIVFWIPAHGAVVPGDVLLGDGDGGLELCPPTWLPEKSSVEKVAESLRPLLELPVERVLVSHGEPVLENAKGALASALQSS